VTLNEFQQMVHPSRPRSTPDMRRADGWKPGPLAGSRHKNGPATPEDRLLFILVYLKTSALQVYKGAYS